MLRKLILKKSQGVVGETLIQIARLFGMWGSRLLYRSQWRYGPPEWFDHRHHMLDPDRFGLDHWIMSPANVLSMLPIEGTLLDLCSGDGFFDYHFYQKRAREVVCIDLNKETFSQAKRLHWSPKINYIFTDVLNYSPQKSYFDVVTIRGAIEHFTLEEQKKIVELSFNALKPGGWFCGDTPAAKPSGEKHLESHEYEWKDDTEMKRVLSSAFTLIETNTFVSKDRTTLFWRCQKPIVKS